jgi:hypothetical protein
LETSIESSKTARPGHRPFAPSSEQEDAIVAFIERGYSDGNFVTQRDLLNFAESEFGKCLTYSWVYCLLARNEQTTASTTIRASWLKTGFDYETRDTAT